MADDLVERLRDAGYVLVSPGMRKLAHEAAARIEALEAALAEARRQALEDAAKVAEEYPTLDYQTGIAMKGAAQAIRALASDPLLDRQGKEGDDLPSAIDVAFTVGEEAHKRVGVTPLMREVMALRKQHGHPPSCCCAECAKDWMGDN